METEHLSWRRQDEDWVGFGGHGSSQGYLEDCDVEKGKELAFVGTWIKTRTIG